LPSTRSADRLVHGRLFPLRFRRWRSSACNRGWWLATYRRPTSKTLPELASQPDLQVPQRPPLESKMLLHFNITREAGGINGQRQGVAMAACPACRRLALAAELPLATIGTLLHGDLL
jgi:hypothetical protein